MFMQSCFLADVLEELRLIRKGVAYLGWIERKISELFKESLAQIQVAVSSTSSNQDRGMIQTDGDLKNSPDNGAPNQEILNNDKSDSVIEPNDKSESEMDQQHNMEIKSVNDQQP